MDFGQVDKRCEDGSLIAGDGEEQAVKCEPPLLASGLSTLLISS